MSLRNEIVYKWMNNDSPKGKMKYEIEITYAPYSKDNEVVTLDTDDIELSMNQYQRNRKNFTWKIVKKSA